MSNTTEYSTVLLEKIEQALLESEQDLGQDWDEFKKEWIKEMP